MTIQTARQHLADYQRTMAALGHASGLVYYDGATLAPKKSADVRPNTLGELSRIEYELQCSPETVEMLSCLKDASEELTPVERRSVEILWRNHERLNRIPKEEYVAYTRLLAESDTVWHTAKENDDFESFAPYLQKVFDAARRISGYEKPEMDPYDAALDDYERGMTRTFCDRFFLTLRKQIVPLIQSVSEAEPIDDAPLHASFPVEKQRSFSRYLMQVMNMDPDACILGETEHPFTIGFTKNDVRITTHYYEHDPVSSMYSVIHEGGHALYELGTGDTLMFTGLDSGASMALHESQSRFYENIIGRSRAFSSIVFPYLRREFPLQLSGVTEESFYRMINKSMPSLIRTEADELTYCLHIMVRYELEKAMFDGALTARELRGEWNRLYREYLGVEVPDDRRGILQDSHWANGNIGYFPSYALGSAYGAQFLTEMEKDFDVYAAVRSGELARVNAWNEEHIWRYGALYDPAELFEKVCGQFDPSVYTEYLRRKFTEIYRL